MLARPADPSERDPVLGNIASAHGGAEILVFRQFAGAWKSTILSGDR